MLVLTRRHREKLLIGDDLWVTVLKTDDRRDVRLIVETPAGLDTVTCELGQTVDLGYLNVYIHIVELRQKRVTLGIELPRDVHVQRVDG